MDILQIITMVENKIASHRNMQARFREDGNIDAVNNIDVDIANCEETLSKLNTLI